MAQPDQTAAFAAALRQFVEESVAECLAVVVVGAARILLALPGGRYGRLSAK
jgi:hypothetical protein